MMENFLIPQYHFYRNPIFKQCSLFTITPYSFLFARKLGSTNFQKEYLFTGKKRLPRVFISWEIMTAEKIFPCK